MYSPANESTLGDEQRKEGEENPTSETGVEGHWSIEALINGLFLAELQSEKK